MWALKERKVGRDPNALLWYQKVEEGAVKERIAEGYGDRYDKEGQRLANLFAVGGGSTHVARHLVRMEKARLAEKGEGSGGLNHDSFQHIRNEVGVSEAPPLYKDPYAMPGQHTITSSPMSKYKYGGDLDSMDSVASLESESTFSSKRKQKSKFSPVRKPKGGTLHLGHGDVTNETHAITLSTKQPGGKYYVPALADPYDASCQAYFPLKSTKAGVAQSHRDLNSVPPNISGRICSKADILYRPPVLQDMAGKDTSTGTGTGKLADSLDDILDVMDYGGGGSIGGGGSSIGSPNADNLDEASAYSLVSRMTAMTGGYSVGAGATPLADVADQRVYRNTFKHLQGIADIYKRTDEAAVFSSVSVASGSSAERSKAVSVSNTMPDAHTSDLQAFLDADTAVDQMMVGCGHMRLADEIHAKKKEESIREGLMRQKEYMDAHASWLKRTGTMVTVPEEEEKNIFLTMDFPGKEKKEEKEEAPLVTPNQYKPGHKTDEKRWHAFLAEEEAKKKEVFDKSFGSFKDKVDSEVHVNEYTFYDNWQNDDDGPDKKFEAAAKKPEPIETSDDSPSRSAMGSRNSEYDNASGRPRSGFDSPMNSRPSTTGRERSGTSTGTGTFTGTVPTSTSTGRRESELERLDSNPTPTRTPPAIPAHKTPLALAQRQAELERLKERGDYATEDDLSQLDSWESSSKASSVAGSAWSLLSKDKPGYVPTLEGLVGPGHSPKKGAHESSSYLRDSVDFLHVRQDPVNPFRPASPRLANMKQLSRNLDGKAAREAGGGAPGHTHYDTIHTAYDRGVAVSEVGGWAAVIKSDPSSSRPSKERIRKGLTSVARFNLLSFDTRIVETGTIIKAVQDNRLPAPGVAAVMELHSLFIDAAAMNPNPWVVHRSQFTTVMSSFLPWVPREVIGRLFSAYDPEHSGVMRYVRLTSALIAGSRPAMAQLIGLLSEDTRYFKFAGEIVVIKLIHYLYEQCEGGKKHDAMYHNKEDAFRKVAVSQSEMLTGTDGVGMRITDIMEALSCCVTTVTDAVLMEDTVQEVVQVLFDDGQLKDIVGGSIYKELLKENGSTAALHLHGDDDDATSVASGVGSLGSYGISSKSRSVILATGEYSLLSSSRDRQRSIGDMNSMISMSTGTRTGLPGDPDYLHSIAAENQRTSTEKSWRLKSGQRRQWQASLKERVDGSFDETKGFTGPDGTVFYGGESQWSDASSTGGGMFGNSKSTTKRSGAKFGRSGASLASSTNSLGRSIPDASVVLKHQNLRAVKHIPRITKLDLVAAMMKLPRPIAEFSRQVHKFRRLMEPYVLLGSTNFSDASLKKEKYGSFDTSKVV